MLRHWRRHWNQHGHPHPLRHWPDGGSAAQVASEKGVVVGRLQFEEAGDTIDCTKMGVGGKAIPPHIDKVTNVRSDAVFILLVEKDAAFMRLAEDRFYNNYPCVIVTAKGQPDVATRLFLRKLKQTLKIPVLALVDSDPYGLKILSVYMKVCCVLPLALSLSSGMLPHYSDARDRQIHALPSITRSSQDPPIPLASEACHP